LGTLVLGGAALLLGWHYRLYFAAPLRALPVRHALFLLGSLTMITVCFFLAQNIAYRGIYLIMAVPGLYHMARGMPPAARRRVMVLLLALVYFEWEPAIRHALGTAAYPQMRFWLFRECLWWWVISQFAAVIMAFIGLEWGRICRKIKLSRQPV